MTMCVFALVAEGWIESRHVDYRRPNQRMASPHARVDHAYNGRVIGWAGDVIWQRADVLKRSEFIRSQGWNRDRVYEAHLIEFSYAQCNIPISTYTSEYDCSAHANVLVYPRAPQYTNPRPGFIKPVSADRSIRVEPEFYVELINRVWCLVERLHKTLADPIRGFEWPKLINCIEEVLEH
ncbi:hypothetical protein A5708_21185 [Mycobacterium colombiense]|uniref:Uncharacterized protein n=1 Tax=Mycobacterium colombiense TaxID=339268 RepID=A0A1A2YWR7_9MYCO|nr:hypothetical protein A5708_21185 [Mycobacterium colombiense]